MYTIYRTTNLVNGKYYIGIHKTQNPNDDYLGSGRYIKAAVAKHGATSFVKEVLFLYESGAEAFSCEERLVAEHSVDPLCMNIRKGGTGGFDYLNSSGIAARTKSLTGRISTTKTWARVACDPEYKASFLAKLRAGLALGRARLTKAQLQEAGRRVSRLWTGRSHSEVSRSRMAQSNRGAANSQYGTIWITDGTVAKKIMAQDLRSCVEAGWVRGRKSLLRASEPVSREPHKLESKVQLLGSAPNSQRLTS